MKSVGAGIVLALFSIAGAAAEEPIQTGGCLAITVRNQGGAGPDLTKWCSQFESFSASDNPRYRAQFEDFLGPLLRGAFDQAEKASCGFVGCRTSDMTVRLVYYSDGFPNVWVSRGTNWVVIAMDIGMSNFVNYAVLGFMRDAETNGRATDGLEGMLASLRDAGGKSCRSPMLKPPLPPREDLAKMVLTPSMSIYSFLLGHELAHLSAPGGASCGYTGDDPLELENACDRVAVASLLKWPGFVPVVVPILPVLLQANEKLRSPLIMGTLGTPGPFSEAFPGRNWGARAKAFLASWQRACTSSASETNACKDAGEFAELVERYRREVLPRPCKLD